MYTSLGRELQNESAGRIFPLFRHLAHDGNMACTFQNISFTEAKPLVVENHHVVTKNDTQNMHSSDRKNVTKQIACFLTFFGPEPSENSAPAETG